MLWKNILKKIINNSLFSTASGDGDLTINWWWLLGDGYLVTGDVWSAYLVILHLMVADIVIHLMVVDIVLDLIGGGYH